MVVYIPTSITLKHWLNLQRTKGLTGSTFMDSWMEETYPLHQGSSLSENWKHILLKWVQGRLHRSVEDTMPWTETTDGKELKKPMMCLSTARENTRNPQWSAWKKPTRTESQMNSFFLRSSVRKVHPQPPSKTETL